MTSNAPSDAPSPMFEYRIHMLEEKLHETQTQLETVKLEYAKAIPNALSAQTSHYTTTVSIIALALTLISIMGYKAVEAWVKNRVHTLTTEKITELQSKFDTLYTNQTNQHQTLLDEMQKNKKDTDKQLEAFRLFGQGNKALDEGKHDEGKYSEGIEYFSKSLALYENFATYVNRGTAKAKSQDFTGAIADYNEAIRLKPDYAAAYYNRGIAKAYLQDFTSAIADYNEAIRLHPDYAATYVNRGVAKTRSQDFTGAIADYNEAIRLKPDYAAAYFNKACAFALQNTSVQDVLAPLSEAIRWDENNKKLAREDDDFTSYRSDPTFRHLVGLPPLQDTP
jgi:tetratricopeptide (TPR) repeat protein